MTKVYNKSTMKKQNGGIKTKQNRNKILTQRNNVITLLTLFTLLFYLQYFIRVFVVRKEPEETNKRGCVNPNQPRNLHKQRRNVLWKTVESYNQSMYQRHTRESQKTHITEINTEIKTNKETVSTGKTVESYNESMYPRHTRES